MNSKDPNIISASEIKHRLVIPIQTRGGLGKSTTAIGLCEWWQERGVPWQGYDLDIFNRTLSTVFPHEVVPIQLSQEPEGDLIQIFREVNTQAVTLVDPSAHMNKIILSALDKSDFTKLAVQQQARASVLIYPYDEVSDMDDISETVATLGDQVDWVVIRNKAKIPTTRFFDGSELEAQLREYKAAELIIPELLSHTRSHLRAHEVQLKRGLSPAEAVTNLEIKIDMVHRVILQKWLAELFQRFDAIAPHLMPDAAAKSIQPVKSNPKRALKRETAINLGNIL